jgi:hypothetical protein
MESLEQSVREGRRQLWMPEDNSWALLTQIDVYPAMKVLNVFWAGGTLPEDYGEILTDIEAWGAAQGCKQADANGRLGWLRALQGYRRAPWVNLVKDIGHV